MCLIGLAPGAEGANKRKALRTVFDGLGRIAIDSLLVALTGAAV